MKNVIKEILISQLSFPLKYKNEKEIWWEDKRGNPITIEIVSIENEQCVVRGYYYKDGKLRYETNLNHGKHYGKYLEWYNDGQLKFKINYHQGQMHGEYLWWYRNGQLLLKENYYQGERHGEYLEWRKDGKLLCRAEFDHGKIVNEKHY